MENPEPKRRKASFHLELPPLFPLAAWLRGPHTFVFPLEESQEEQVESVESPMSPESEVEVKPPRRLEQLALKPTLDDLLWLGL